MNPVSTYPLGRLELWKVSHSITEVKQRLARLYLDGGYPTRIEFFKF